MIFKKKTFQTFEHSLFQMDWISSKIVADQLYVFFFKWNPHYYIIQLLKRTYRNDFSHVSVCSIIVI